MDLDQDQPPGPHRQRPPAQDLMHQERQMKTRADSESG
jgi:hypothetical protein